MEGEIKWEIFHCSGLVVFIFYGFVLFFLARFDSSTAQAHREQPRCFSMVVKKEKIDEFNKQSSSAVQKKVEPPYQSE
ncbi:hypothetical protein CsSME_00009692 [Camellia sinensis var. sinensis]